MSLSISSSSLRVENHVHNLLAPMLRNIEFSRNEITRVMEEQMALNQELINNQVLFEQSIREDIEKDRVRAEENLAMAKFVLDNKLYKGNHIKEFLEKCCKITTRLLTE